MAVRRILKDTVLFNHAAQLESVLRPYIPITKASKQLDKNCLPPFSELLFFNPCIDERQLDLDGFDNTHIPFRNGANYGKFELRWLDGEVKFIKPICLGQAVCTESSVLAKDNNARKEVSLTRAYTSMHGELALLESRTYSCLLRGSKLHARSKQMPLQYSDTDLSNCLTLELSSTLAFRYAALTFNAHKIHYDLAYSKSEQLKRPIAQGPLLATIALRYVYETYDGAISYYKYKNTAPAFINDKIAVNAKFNGKEVEVMLINSETKHVVHMGRVGFA